MNEERWRQVEDLFHAAMERAPEARQSFLDEACGADAELRQQVGLLVSSDERADSFLEQPVLSATPEPPPRGPSVGQQLGHYRILSALGAGGMGEVFCARDLTLDREVAIKTLPPAFADDPSRLARLEREARALAALNHPNIATIHGLERLDGALCLVLELVDGESLRGPLPLSIALDRAGQVAEAIEAAHEHGVIHRDLKPRNIKVTPQGRVKVLDFGLAKSVQPAPGGADRSQPPTTADTSAWPVLGTPGYMSPEQARGAVVDERTDIWAFGCLLYELLAGRRAFPGRTNADAMVAGLECAPDWHALPRGTPRPVVELLHRCLEKDAERRPQRMSDVKADIERARRGPGGWQRMANTVRRPRVAVPAAAILVLLALAGAWLYQRASRARWVRNEAIPEILRLADAGDFVEAYRWIRRAEAVAPDDSALRRLHRGVPTTFETSPAGAEVWATGYRPDDDDWVRLGTTPFTTRELPFGLYRLRVEKPGFQAILGSVEVMAGTSLHFELDRKGALPPEMVRIPAGRTTVFGAGVASVAAFLIDRFEVTNSEFKRFVDAGGYQKREYWTEEFVDGGRRPQWDEAMRVFSDATGQPGPATWELGDYPAGHERHPVSGVSWYEAAAYAAFAGKRLPTVFHWERAASPGWYADGAQLSNFGPAGPAPVGSNHGIGAHGTFDMAGNVREWCANAIGDQRVVRGGAWNEPIDMFATLEGQSPWDRSAQNGFRCARYEERQQTTLQAPLERGVTDSRWREPISEEVFRHYESFYAYDRKDLDARGEGVDEDTRDWTRQQVSFSAPYGSERIVASFYIPKRAKPPYQTILYANPGMAFRLASPERDEERIFDFLIKSGRAFLHPVLKGYYQRRYAAPAAGPLEDRDRTVLESKDFRRCLDYLTSRPDVDTERIGVYGGSLGALRLPILAVGERRLKAAALWSVGLLPPGEPAPEADTVHFLPRFRVPTLMVNGRYDFYFPLETAQRPMLRLLGAADKDKKLTHWNGSHGDLGRHFRMVVKETLDWFDLYLGPVTITR